MKILIYFLENKIFENFNDDVIYLDGPHLFAENFLSKITRTKWNSKILSGSMRVIALHGWKNAYAKSV